MASEKSQKRSEWAAVQQKKERRDKAIYAVLIACVVLFLAIYWLKPLTIGGDIKYHIFVEALPVAIGIALFILNRKKLLDAKAVASVTNIWKKIAYSAVLLFGAALLSYITLGSFTILTFELANYYKARSTKQQTVILPVDEFHKGSGSKAKHSIRFGFKGKEECIKVSRKYIDHLRAEPAAKHHIKLKLREGLWNHYLVDEWDVIK